ncbi:hypothetical protein TRICI_004208 [Trichomonascus ciferrii]|uniref:Uncharacterized protein n=1 Tax=Trichomonascus ciferrii TaxID=44093 RepID=A0A642V1H2_9ASCO|nr:hypothetical protein TRICI_004208 [Trichomonascus ciferrii]
MKVPVKYAPSVFLIATNAILATAENNTDMTSDMILTASQMASIVGRGIGLTKGDGVDSKVVENDFICPLANNVADMVSKTLEEVGDQPQGKTKGLLNQFSGLSKSIEKVSSERDVSCDGLESMQEQAKKVTSLNRKRDDSGEDEDGVDTDFEKKDDEHYETSDAFALLSQRSLGILVRAGHITGEGRLPEDFLCGSVDTTTKAVDTLKGKMSTTLHKETKKNIGRAVTNGYRFTENAKNNSISCDSKVSNLAKSLKNIGKEAGIAQSRASESATASSLATKIASQTATPTDGSSSEETAAEVSNNVASPKNSFNALYIGILFSHNRQYPFPRSMGYVQLNHLFTSRQRSKRRSVLGPVLCHNPQIDRIVVDVADAQWFCRDCQPRRRELPLETGITGEGLSLEMKKTYLSSLSKAQLIELIEYAETLEPKLPLYSPNTHSLALKMQLQNNKRLHQSGSKVDYEDLLVDAMNAKAMGKGVELSQIWSWIEKDTNSANTIDSSFLQSATRALQRALRRGRIIKNGNLYYVNPSYQPPSELSLSQYLSTDDEALFSEIPMRIPPPTEEDQYFCIDDNDEVFSHKVYIKT